jgi:hypothetical protein
MYISVFILINDYLYTWFEEIDHAVLGPLKPPGIYIYIYIYIYVYIYIEIYTHIYIYISVFISINDYLYTWFEEIEHEVLGPL